MKDKPMSESVLQKNVIEYAKWLGYTLIYHTWNSIHSPSGFPDLVLCRPSDKRIIYIELKSEKGPLTKPAPMRPNWTSQEEWIEGLEACGQEVYVFRPSDLDHIMNILKYKNPGKEGS